MSTSLPLATAAAVATLFASPAGAAPNDQPTTPAPVQPGTTDPEAGPQTTQPSPSPSQPGIQDPQDKQGSTPTPSQPGVVTPEQDSAPGDQKPTRPVQPGVTPPRVAPLPVPGRPDSADPALTPREQGAPAPEGSAPRAQQPGAEDAEAPDSETPDSELETLVQPPAWQAPRFESAPAAPVVEMEGPHAEFGASIDGGSLLPGHVANTHHFTNESGYVGTVGYRTPEGPGEAGVSVEFVDVNTVKVDAFVGGPGLTDQTVGTVIDTTQLNAARAAVEQWIAAQPGGQAALDAAAQIKPPPLFPAGDFGPETIDIAGATTQWGGSLQY
ncbi:hypothetical protein [Nocardia paucivorans]|uniref:hypothetical protein n=1 Tax=Nocardia paucivorans TaxID=114259 RepID=UPI001FE12EAB|nr:hypothetical protein [Nocardia paucivorans]